MTSTVLLSSSILLFIMSCRLSDGQNLLPLNILYIVLTAAVMMSIPAMMSVVSAMANDIFTKNTIRSNASPTMFSIADILSIFVLLFYF